MYVYDIHSRTYSYSFNRHCSQNIKALKRGVTAYLRGVSLPMYSRIYDLFVVDFICCMAHGFGFGSWLVAEQLPRLPQETCAKTIRTVYV